MRFLITMIFAVFACTNALALDIGVSEVKALHPNAAVVSTGVGAAVDLADYEGNIVVVLDATAQGSGISNAMKVTESDTSGGTYTDVVGGGFTAVVNAASAQVIVLNSDKMKRYIKLSKTVTGGSGTGYVAASVIGYKKYR